MDTARSRQIEELYHAALGLAPDARAALLAGADPQVRQEVKSLIEQDTVDGFLDQPIFQAAAQLLNPGPHSETDEPPLPKRIGQYRILARLGEGGMGAVYKAEQEHPRRVVALKVIKPGWSTPELLRRFDLESQALGRLQHPGIARIYEAGAADAGFGAQPYFAMELIEGQSLRKYAEANRMSTRARLETMAKVCEAVHHAHQRGIIHRDLKPGNILVDQTGQPKILDFGVARITDSDAQTTRQTDLGQLVGTLAYMSPEQVSADPLQLDTRSDVYALGVILYELLAERLPYLLSRRLHEAVQTIRETEPAPLSSINTHYRGDIETIVAKALEKDKARRYTSAAELAADIRHYLDDQPIAARPPSASYQLQKFARRNRVLVTGVAAVFVVLVGGIVTSSWQAVRANHAGQAAVAERDRAFEAEAKARAAEQAATKERNSAIAAQTQAIEERNRAVKEKHRADNEAAIAKAVSDFLQGDLLAQASANTQASPGAKPDPDLKVRTALDRAAARIPGKFEKQPLVEAAIRQTIANTYKDLGLYPEAQGQLERGLELRARVQGKEHPDTLSAMSDLADVYIDQGKFAPAQALHGKVLEIRRRVLGEENPATLRSMGNEAVAFEKQGQYAQAEPLQAKALEILRRVQGEEHHDTLEATIDLALLYVRLGNLAQAEALDAKAVEIMRRVLGEEHPDTLNGMNNLAQVYYRQDKYAQAEAIQSTVVEIRRRVLGEEHNDTLVSMNNLAVIYDGQGQYAQAEEIQATALAILRRVLGEEHPNTLIDMSNLARVYSHEGKDAQAEALNVKVLEIRRRVLGEEHPSTLISMENLAGLYRKQAKYAQAEPLYKKVLEIRRKALGPQHPQTTDVMTSLGGLRLEERRYDDAEPLVREALKILEQTSPDAWKRYYLQSLSGAVLTGQKRYADAEPLLLSGYAGLIQRKATIPTSSKSDLADAGDWIVQLYRDWGQPDKATEWQARLESEKTAASRALLK
jgi:tetratricopeptide (TPR) repeat protein